METILLYKTNFYHSYSSRELIGVFTNKNKFIQEIKKIIKKDLTEDPQDMEGEELKSYINWNISFFLKQEQTQGLSSFELVYEKIKTNTII